AIPQRASLDSRSAADVGAPLSVRCYNVCANRSYRARTAEAAGDATAPIKGKETRVPAHTSRKTASSESSSHATALRSASCGELTAANEGQRVVLAGWVAHRRDYGKLIFIDLRDRYGLTQIVIDPERSPEAAEAHGV